MKQKFLLAFSILTILTLSACGGAAPTLTAEEIAYTAVAQAWLAITQTRAVAPPASTPGPADARPDFHRYPRPNPGRASDPADRNDGCGYNPDSAMQPAPVSRTQRGANDR
ncbi:MAG: hypothetical protein HND47_01400 [Chloroflexi bacterium]|nr:hypothetical protein [Chloroflexota bacterium]